MLTGASGSLIQRTSLKTSKPAVTPNFVWRLWSRDRFVISRPDIGGGRIEKAAT